MLVVVNLFALIARQQMVVVRNVRNMKVSVNMKKSTQQCKKCEDVRPHIKAGLFSDGRQLWMCKNCGHRHMDAKENVKKVDPTTLVSVRLTDNDYSILRKLEGKNNSDKIRFAILTSKKGETK